MALLDDWRNGADLAAGVMNDYKRVRNSNRGYKRLSPRDTRQIHLLSLQRMQNFFEQHDPAKTIVLTHHAPSILSLPLSRRADPISCAYASHLDDFILRQQPHLWVHGHIHHSNDYYIGRTRVLANPQGYPDEPNPDFNPVMMVEVPD
jgi:hypothetical protein